MPRIIFLHEKKNKFVLSSATTPLSDTQGWAYFGSLHILENYNVFTRVFVKIQS